MEMKENELQDLQGQYKRITILQLIFEDRQINLSMSQIKIEFQKNLINRQERVNVFNCKLFIKEDTVNIFRKKGLNLKARLQRWTKLLKLKKIL